MATSDKSFNGELLESIFKTSKKTIQEYVREIERNNRYRSCRQDTGSGYILDDRARLIDLYEACLQQDAHIRSVVETLESQILGDRYMLARVNEKGKYIKDVKYYTFGDNRNEQAARAYWAKIKGEDKL